MVLDSPQRRRIDILCPVKTRVAQVVTSKEEILRRYLCKHRLIARLYIIDAPCSYRITYMYKQDGRIGNEGSESNGVVYCFRVEYSGHELEWYLAVKREAAPS